MIKSLESILCRDEIKAFVDYQEMLFEAFKKKFHHLSEEQLTYLHKLPEKQGTINDKEGNSWAFQKHGEGIRFEQKKDGLVIDIDRNLQETQKFDAGRLCWYLESVHGIEIDTREITETLDNYVSMGVLEKEKYSYRLLG